MTHTRRRYPYSYTVQAGACSMDDVVYQCSNARKAKAFARQYAKEHDAVVDVYRRSTFIRPAWLDGPPVRRERIAIYWPDYAMPSSLSKTPRCARCSAILPTSHTIPFCDQCLEDIGYPEEEHTS